MIEGLLIVFGLLYWLLELRVTSLEQLSVAELSGEKARPKVYENIHKNVPVVQFHLVLNVKTLADF